MFVINNTSKPKYVLKKKNDDVCYNCTQILAIGEFLTDHIDGNKNPADLMTNVLCGGKKRYLVNKILHYVYDGEFRPSTETKQASIPMIQF